MSASPSPATRSRPRPRTWVESLGGPLIVLPVSALADWHGCTGSGMVGGDPNAPDDYDRACEVGGLAGVIDVGEHGAQGLVLADEPATTCYLPEHRAFVRWVAADSEADLIAGAETVLTDPATEWEECGTWVTDGPAVLLDSVIAGAELTIEYPGGGFPDQAPLPLPAGHWTVHAVHTRADGRTSVSLVQLRRSDD